MDPKLIDCQNSFRDLTRMVPGSNPTGTTSHEQSLFRDVCLVSNGEFSPNAVNGVQHRICSMCQRNLTGQTARQTDRQRRQTDKRRDRSFVHTWSWVVLVLASLVVCLVAMVICLMMSVNRLQQKVLDIQQHCQRRPQEKHLVLTDTRTQSLNHNGTHTSQYSHTVLDNSQLVRKPANFLEVAKLSESFREVAKRPESEVAKLLSRPVRQSGKGKGKGKVNGSCTNQATILKFCDTYNRKQEAPASVEYFANFYDHYNISDFINRNTECFIDKNLPLSPKVCQMATMKYENASSALTLYRANSSMSDNRTKLVELTDEINGVFTVKKSGIFIIRLEIILVDEDFNHSVGIFQNNLPTLACRRGGFYYKYPSSNTNVDVTRFRICTINGVLELKTNDTLQIKTIEPHTTVRFDPKPLSVFRLTLLPPSTKKGKKV
ncbi:uncharacterized protein LOC131947116 isoform X2 [Physella acuta]|uniref:uncharacterized protein LOC131947116 isoform X2 n=1 Tax=Physella acuta TaxID=109671 RepID=UPI0027DE7E59|nr:uncharacterized protein LOC131947116 isoform X2 [Physella acuta]